MQLDRAKILSLIEEGYLMVNDHPSLPLRIYNYTRKSQFEKYWNEYTLLSRGLVLDHDYNVVAMPFKKFFNYEEHKIEEIPNTNFKVFDKMDGSLGIMFNYDNTWHIATRGSFISDQAVKAKKIVEKYNVSELDPFVTYLFEIIYPENRIVVDYNGEEKLVLLGIIHNKNGYDMPYDIIKYHVGIRNIDIPLVKIYDGVNDISELKSRNILNEEGYVLRYENNFRMKVKFEDYVRLHSIITNISTKDIWECLREGRDIDELLDRTPDEFDEWVRGQVNTLNEEFKRVEENSRSLFNVIYVDGITQKDFAQKALLWSVSSILFKMLEKKSYDHIIWKMIEPKWSKPFFKQDDEE